MDLIELVFLGIMILTIIGGFIAFTIVMYKSDKETENLIKEMNEQHESLEEKRGEKIDKIVNIIYNNLTKKQKKQLKKIIEEIESI